MAKMLEPHSSVAERAALGWMLLYSELLDGLEAEDFYIERHRWVFEALLSVGFDLVAIGDALEQKGRLEQIGGLPFLYSLFADAPPRPGGERWVGILKEKRRVRERVRAAGAMAQAIAAGETDLERLFHELFPSPAEDQETENGLAEVASALLEALQSGEVSGIPLGFPRLEALVGRLRPSMFFILSGQTSVGKTALSLNVASAALLAGARVLYCTLEMSPLRCLQRLASSFTGVPLSKILRGELDDREVELISHFLGGFVEAPLYLRTDASLEALEEVARELHPDLIVVDYIQRLRLSGVDERDRVRAMEAISGRLKSLSALAPIWAISSLSREGELRWSGDLDYDADVKLLLERERLCLAKVKVVKNRDGPLGECYLGFVPQLQRFVELRKERSRA